MRRIVLVDIDGTISKVGDRLEHLKETPTNWDKFYERCDEDDPIYTIINLVTDLYNCGYRIIFCTGRRKSCLENTIKWINTHFKCSIASENNILMRNDNDWRHDVFVKPELLEKSRIDLQDIAIVLEDRNSMVEKWRSLGLTCLQVADGDF